IGMINFAHGDIYMIGAFQSLIVILVLGFFGVTWVPLALVFVLLIAVSLTALYGWAVERVAYRPLRGSTRLAPLISAIGMAIILSKPVLLPQGKPRKPFTPTTDEPVRGAVPAADARRHQRADHRQADHDHGGDRARHGRLHAADQANVARAPATRLRAGHEDGLAARREHQPDDLTDLRDGRSARL